MTYNAKNSHTRTRGIHKMNTVVKFDNAAFKDKVSTETC